MDYEKLKQRLLADKQILAWTGKPAAARSAIDPQKLPGIVLDDAQAQLKGEWSHSTAQAPYIGQGYLHDGNEKKAVKSARFVTTIKSAGSYEVRLALHRAGQPGNVECSGSRFRIHLRLTPHSMKINQRQQRRANRLAVDFPGNVRFHSGRDGGGGDLQRGHRWVCDRGCRAVAGEVKGHAANGSVGRARKPRSVSPRRK